MIFFASVVVIAVCLMFWRIRVLRKQTAELRLRIERQEKLLEAMSARLFPAGLLEPDRPPETDAPILELPQEAETPAEDWEATVGANWLNRLGAVVLVIGIALFLGYSLTRFGPAGKVMIGFSAGASLLAAGIALERQSAFRAFAFSLMGAGWAVVYFSAYAMHGLPAARLIENPVAGMAALIAVSAGMIAHAARYRSETAAALAFLLAFAGLNVSPATTFSLAATVLLALSLAGLAWQFRWLHLPLLGVAATYGTFALRYQQQGQIALWIYWLLFEGFDLSRSRRERLLFLCNACGFTAAGLYHHWVLNTGGWWPFLALASGAYFVSAVIRMRTGAAYELAGSVSAMLLAAAVTQRFTGPSANLALAVEGEIVLRAGRQLASKWLVWAGSLLLALPLIRLLLFDVPGPRIAGTWQPWTPVALLLAVLYADKRRMFPDAWYFAAASGIAFVVAIEAEAPRLWVAPLIAGIAALLVWLRHRDLSLLAAAALLVAAGRAAIVNIGDGDLVSTGIVIGAVFAAQLVWPGTDRWMKPALTVLGAALLVLLTYEKSQGRLLTAVLGCEAAALLAGGFVRGERSFRIAGLAIFLLCIGKLFLYDLRELDTPSRILSFVLLGILLMAASWLYTKYREKLRRLL